MKLKSLMFLLFTALLCLNGQEFRATISGHVLDATGAAVPGTKIQAINTQTNEITNATSDAAGAYTIPFLRPGTYKLTAAATGFKQFVKDNVVLEAAKVAGIDIPLQVGAVTESVEVSAQAVMLETQSATRDQIVDTKQVAEMPLNARNPFMLGAMMSGVTFNGAAIWQRPFDNGAIAEWSMNGGRDSSSEFYLDGASNDGQMGSNNIALVPTVDSVQEFNVMANIYDAEYGHTGSGIMNVVLKSGGSQHHGTAYEFMRRSPLDANTFQNNAIGQPKTTHYLDQYGFEVDGPIQVPRLLPKDGKVKLFYMGALELYREGTPNPLVVSYPTQDMRNGDFSKLVDGTGQPITIYNPFTGTNGLNRQPFPNNTIPQSLINPIASAVSQYMPLPNQASPPGYRYANDDLALPNYFDKDKFYNLALKFDWNFGDRNRAFFRHASNDRTEDRASNGIDNKPGTDGQQPFQRINDAYVADWVGTMSPTFILNARASYNRFIEKGYGAANAGFDLTSLGISPSLLSQLPSPQYFGYWSFDNGYSELGRSQSNNYSNTYEMQLSATKVAGSHTLKAGVDIRQVNYELQNTGNILSYNGQQTWTQNQWGGASPNPNSGDGYASFLMGLVNGSSNYPLFPWWKQWYVAPYFTDDWKVTKKFSLQLGIRWDLLSPQYEKWGRQNGWFDPDVASPVASQVAANVATLGSQIPANLAPIYAGLANMKGGLTFAGTGGLGQDPYPWDKNNIQPRVGFAYQFNDKLVMRGGFGEYFSDPANDYEQTNGFSTSTNIVNSLDGGMTPIANILSNPYPTGIQVPTGSSLGAATFVGRSPNWFSPNFVTPSVWQFSVGFQYQTTKDSTLEVSYVGSRSYNLNMNADYNIPSLSVRQSCNLLEGGDPNLCNSQVPNPFKGIAAFNGTSYYTSNTISYYNLTRPYPQFNGALEQYGRNDSWIKYNSLQINYNLRSRKGINILANYTLSKQMEEWGLNDPFTDTYQDGPYYLDRPQVFKLNAIYDLPFGQGKTLFSGAHGLVNKLISGWEWSNTFTYSPSGYPANQPGNAIMLKDPQKPVKGANGQWVGGYDGSVNWNAYQVREWNPCVLKQYNDGHIAPTPASIGLGCGTDFTNNWGNYAWLETASYAPRYTPYRSGQIRVNAPLYLDASVLKTTKINERMRFQFGFEAFNLLNHNYFGRDNLNTSVEDPNFGSIIPAYASTQNMLPRFLQVRFKFYW